jgi:hypothetical protein
MNCEAVYPALAETFSKMLSATEVLEPYRNSRSKWANAVQWAVMHLRSGGTLLPVERSGRGVWALSDRNFPPLGGNYLDADELLRQILGNEGEA